MEFDAYVAARGDGLLRFAYVLTRDRRAAEDVVQSALADAFRHWRRVSRAEHPDACVRAVLVLRYYADLDDAAISQVLGISASSVRATASRALSQLRSSQRFAGISLGDQEGTDDRIGGTLSAASISAGR